MMSLHGSQQRRHAPNLQEPGPVRARPSALDEIRERPRPLPLHPFVPRVPEEGLNHGSDAAESPYKLRGRLVERRDVEHDPTCLLKQLGVPAAHGARQNSGGGTSAFPLLTGEVRNIRFFWQWAAASPPKIHQRVCERGETPRRGGIGSSPVGDVIQGYPTSSGGGTRGSSPVGEHGLDHAVESHPARHAHLVGVAPVCKAPHRAQGGALDG